MKENIKRFIPFGISAFTVIVTFFLQFTVFSVNSKFSWAEFFPQFAINMFALTSTAIIWLNSGTRRAKDENGSAYKSNAAIYAGQIQKISDGGRLCELQAFCRAKTAEMRESKINSILIGVGIDRSVYDSTLKELSKEQLKKDGYNRRQIKAIERIRNGQVHSKSIHYMDLLSDSNSGDEYGVNYDERLDKTMRIGFRVIRAATTTLVFSLIGIDLVREITNMAAWVMFFMRLFTIVWTAYSSDHEGYARITETKNKVLLRRIAFLHEFDEWSSVPKLNKGKEETDGRS